MEQYVVMVVHSASCTPEVSSQTGKRLEGFPVESIGQALVEATRTIPGHTNADRDHGGEPLETEASRQLVLDYYDAQGDPDKLARILADDVEWTTPATAPVPGANGRDAVLKLMAEAGGRFFDMDTMESETRGVVADGDTVVVLQSMRCVAANGRDYSNEYIWVFKCAGGRIVRMEEHLDTSRFQQIVLDP